MLIYQYALQMTELELVNSPLQFSLIRGFFHPFLSIKIQQGNTDHFSTSEIEEKNERIALFLFSCHLSQVLIVVIYYFVYNLVENSINKINSIIISINYKS